MVTQTWEMDLPLTISESISDRAERQIWNNEMNEALKVENEKIVNLWHF